MLLPLATRRDSLRLGNALATAAPYGSWDSGSAYCAGWGSAIWAASAAVVGGPWQAQQAMTNPTHADLLDFEHAHPRHSGWKDEAIRRTFGITPTRYYVLLSRAAQSLDGMAHDAVTARRVRRRGESRRDSGLTPFDAARPA